MIQMHGENRIRKNHTGGTNDRLEHALVGVAARAAVESQKNGFFEREITPYVLPDGSVVSKDDGPRPGTTLAT